MNIYEYSRLLVNIYICENVGIYIYVNMKNEYDIFVYEYTNLNMLLFDYE